MRDMDCDAEFIHDEIEQFENTMSDEFENVNMKIRFENSKESDLLQLSDNIVSITPILFSEMKRLFFSEKIFEGSSKWCLMNMARILKKISIPNVKFTVDPTGYSYALCIEKMFSEDYPKDRMKLECFYDLYYKAL